MRAGGRWEYKDDDDYDYDDNQGIFPVIILISLVPIWILAYILLAHSKARDNAGLIALAVSITLIYVIKEYIVIVGIVCFFILKKYDFK